MPKILCLFFLCLFKINALIGQDYPKNSLNELLSSLNNNTCIAVEGYYVDNSSFMVIYSSDPTISSNARYPVYEHKYQPNLNNTKSANMVEVPIFTQRKIQGEENRRILFLNRKLTNKNQLILDKVSIDGIIIIGNKAKYIQAIDNRIYFAFLADLREFLFNKGPMPIIEEEITSFSPREKTFIYL